MVYIFVRTTDSENSLKVLYMKHTKTRASKWEYLQGQHFLITARNLKQNLGL